MHKRTSYILAVITMIFWGTAFPFSKRLIDNPLNPIVFLTLRMSFAFGALLVYLLVTKQVKLWLKYLKEHFWLLFLLGMGLYNLSYVIQYFGVRFTTATNQTIISNTTTFFVVIFNYLWFRHKPSKLFVVNMMVGFAGVSLIILNDEFHINSDTLLGDVITLLAFIIWALYVVMNRHLTSDVPPLFVTVSVFFFTCLFLIPTSFFFNITNEISLLDLGEWGILAYLGIICSGISTLMYTLALANTDIPSENLALIGFLLPVVGILVSILLLGEPLSWRIIVGCGVVLISVFLVEKQPIPSE